ncbi:MAG TPA: universal stress protein [Candidatus Acidoferrum sp.]|nr:universal stress protein [Candidatus Acidoferrum sp.]
MAIKDILVQVDGGKSAPARYAAAIELARTHDAHLTGLCLAIEQAVPVTILGMVPAEAIAAQREAVREQGEAAIARFRLALERAGISGEGRLVPVRDFDAVDVFVQHGRHSDLVILGQQDPADFLPVARSFPADVVMGCGRPGVVIPYIGTPPIFGQHVLIAWDGGREAARAVNDAMPVLERAHSVTVLCVNPDLSSDERRDPGADISLHLARHGVKVTAARTIARETSVGHVIVDTSISDVMLADIAENGIDLLVMGAYGHSRLREWVLGGVTRDLLAHMTVPVFLSH